MAFSLPDIIIEQTIREGLKAVKDDLTLIDRIFANMLAPYANRKYGQAEIERIKEDLKKRDWHIVHSFYQINSNMPAVSINLVDDTESELKMLGDYEGQVELVLEEEDITTVVSSVTITAFDAITGKVSVDDSVNLNNIYPNLIFVDANEEEFRIIGGIVTTTGSKSFMVEFEVGGTEPTIGTGNIKSSISSTIYENNLVHNNFRIMVGVHDKEPLFAKYMYILVKFFLVSRKSDLNSRGLFNVTYSGSDFSRNFEYAGDMVYARFLNVSGKNADIWRTDEVPQIEYVDVGVKVDKDQYGTDELGLSNNTIKVAEDGE